MIINSYEASRLRQDNITKRNASLRLLEKEYAHLNYIDEYDLILLNSKFK